MVSLRSIDRWIIYMKQYTICSVDRLSWNFASTGTLCFFRLILNRFLSRDIHWGVTCGTRKQIIFNSSAWQLLFVYFARSPHNSNLHGIHVMVAPELPNYNWQFTKGDSIHCTPRQIQHGFHSGLSPSLYCWNVKKLVVVCSEIKFIIY